MTHDVTSADGRAPGAVTRSTRAPLTCGIVAGPLYIVVVVPQMLTRDGFDISRHPASMPGDGDQGWIQIAGFVAGGLLFVACAIGLHRVLGPAAGPGGTGGPRLIGVLGAGMLGAAAFSADPADGFPPGTPRDRADAIASGSPRTANRGPRTANRGPRTDAGEHRVAPAAGTIHRMEKRLRWRRRR
ncbi:MULTISPECIES: DUF998 domain-containing protein [unclassified Nonomuraea]|uniref:DUF998 domain-containing protein n=1 Tax=unclassified Nonomuraea TaxID=2593643 RepID=UPI0033E1FB59